MNVQYLIDENLPPSFVTQLRRHAPDIPVWRVGDTGAPPRSTPDPMLLRWCEENSAILVTNDRASMPVHLANHLSPGNHVPGIIEIDREGGIGANLEELILIAGASIENEWRERITYLPLAGSG